MSFQALPDDILLGIFQHVSSWKKNSRVDFKQRLYLLTVFQRLRAITLPKIYNAVYITSSTYGSHKRQNYTNKYCKIFTKCIDTNADIIALANCTHVVRYAKIDIGGSSTTYAELYSYIEALQFCANSWSNITRLEIYMRYNFYSRNISETHSRQLCQTGIKFGQELANVMPGVKELTLLSSCYNYAISEFYIHVADEYANQLVKLTNECGFNHIGSHKFKAMQYLHLSMNNYNTLPRVNSHTLVDLHIESVSVNVPWAPFMDNINDTVIEFLCLKRLRLSFTYNEAANSANAIIPEHMIRFPVLSSLTVVCNADVCPFFKMARFPDVMDNIYIRAPPALVAQVKDMEMPTANYIQIHS